MVESGEMEVKKNDDVLNGKTICSMITGFDEMTTKFQEIPHSLEEVPNPDI